MYINLQSWLLWSREKKCNFMRGNKFALSVKDKKMKTTSNFVVESSHRILKFSFWCYDIFLRAYTSSLCILLWAILLNSARNGKVSLKLNFRRLSQIGTHNKKTFFSAENFQIKSENPVRQYQADVTQNEFGFCSDEINGLFDKLGNFPVSICVVFFWLGFADIFASLNIKS